ncbi:MAG: hypothetical protein NZ850_09380, partial [Caldimicrobium sp.]|nr:hypothetical protein [Caldimicrobium sp.]
EKLKELAEAQKETEKKVSELAEAQKRTDEKLKELAEAQKETEKKVSELAEAQKRTDEKLKELAEAQKETEKKVSELAEAQKRSEEEIRRLAEAQRKTEEELRDLRKEFGGFTRTYSYAFENEAYRNLPQVLRRYGIEVTERFIRAEIEGEEINFLARGRRNGREVYIVGEAKLRFDDTKRDFERTFRVLERKVEVVKREYGGVEVVKLIVTHFAKPRALKLAQDKGIIVVQSFEW